MNDIDKILKQVRRIHFIGIGGSGMCPIAEILHSWGYEISGSDNNDGDNITKLRDLGINVILGQKPENLKSAELIVYTDAILKDNPELIAAKNGSVPCFERAAIFGAITRMYNDCIAVCGTHGKTTVTAMLSQVLISAEKDPTCLIGGRLPLIESHGRAGKSDIFVCEACEYKNHYHELSPDTAILLNVDEDHLEFFGNLQNIKASFNKFCSLCQKSVIYNADDKNTVDTVSDLSVKKISFGYSESSDYYPANITYNKGSFPEFDVMFKGKKIAHLKLNIPGTHNILNSLACFAAAVNVGCSYEECEKGIDAFSGAGRRFEILGEAKGITIADDYAHHPEELRVTLEAVMKMGYKTVWAVHQPFTYSRTKILFEDFAKVLQIPDRCVMTEIMGSREVNTYGIYTKDLADKIPGSVWFNTFEEVTDYIVANATEGDIVITLGCGDIYKAAKMILKKLDS